MEREVPIECSTVIPKRKNNYTQLPFHGLKSSIRLKLLPYLPKVLMIKENSHTNTPLFCYTQILVLSRKDVTGKNQNTGAWRKQKKTYQYCDFSEACFCFRTSHGNTLFSTTWYPSFFHFLKSSGLWFNLLLSSVPYRVLQMVPRPLPFK